MSVPLCQSRGSRLGRCNKVNNHCHIQHDGRFSGQARELCQTRIGLLADTVTVNWLVIFVILWRLVNNRTPRSGEIDGDKWQPSVLDTNCAELIIDTLVKRQSRPLAAALLSFIIEELYHKYLINCSIIAAE